MKAQGLTALGFVLPVQTSRANVSTHLSAFIRSGVPPRWGPSGGLQRGSKYILTHRTQGLRPGLCRSIAPLGLITRPHQQFHQTIPHHNPYNHNQTKTRTNATIHLHTQKHLTNTIPRHNSANVQYGKEPCKGGTPA